MSAVVWHDIECGSYEADLVLWRALAEEAGGDVLDVGAGTGRVALDLARHGHRVTALDLDPELIAELRRRAGEFGIEAIEADARNFSLGRRFAACLVPMQTVQLLRGASERGRFLACARAHLHPGGLLAMAIVDGLEPFEIGPGVASPLPDVAEHDGVLFWSQPTAVRVDPDGYVLERRRETVSSTGTRDVAEDRIRLDRVSATDLEREGQRAGFTVEARRQVPGDADYVGSEVVVLRA